MAKKTKNRKRTNIKSTKDRLRLSVFKSNRFISAQVINDDQGATLASITTIKYENGGNVSAAEKAGVELAKKLTELKIQKLVFDRGRYRYTGRIKALANALRENGVEI